LPKQLEGLRHEQEQRDDPAKPAIGRVSAAGEGSHERVGTCHLDLGKIERPPARPDRDDPPVELGIRGEECAEARPVPSEPGAPACVGRCQARLPELAEALRAMGGKRRLTDVLFRVVGTGLLFALLHYRASRR
jgi:hypothetical protein